MDIDIDKYINWFDIWDNEIDLDVDIDDQPEFKNVVNQFQKDKDVSLDVSECTIYGGANFVFTFSENGGKSEGDSVGWHRLYFFTFDSDYMLVDAKYEQF